MNVLSGAEDIADWITDRSARATYEFEEEKTRRFEWFLSGDKAKATLIAGLAPQVASPPS